MVYTIQIHEITRTTNHLLKLIVCTMTPKLSLKWDQISSQIPKFEPNGGKSQNLHHLGPNYVVLCLHHHPNSPYQRLVGYMVLTPKCTQTPKIRPNSSSLGPNRKQFGCNLGPNRKQFGCNLGPNRKQFGCNLGASWVYFGGKLGSIWAQFGSRSVIRIMRKACQSLK
jgi:hypothetical protein